MVVYTSPVQNDPLAALAPHTDIELVSVHVAMEPEVTAVHGCQTAAVLMSRWINEIVGRLITVSQSAPVHHAVLLAVVSTRVDAAARLCHCLQVHHSRRVQEYASEHQVESVSAQRPILPRHSGICQHTIMPQLQSNVDKSAQ